MQNNCNRCVARRDDALARARAERGRVAHQRRDRTDPDLLPAFRSVWAPGVAAVVRLAAQLMVNDHDCVVDRVRHAGGPRSPAADRQYTDRGSHVGLGSRLRRSQRPVGPNLHEVLITSAVPGFTLTVMDSMMAVPVYPLAGVGLTGEREARPGRTAGRNPLKSVEPDQSVLPGIWLSIPAARTTPRFGVALPVDGEAVDRLLANHDARDAGDDTHGNSDQAETLPTATSA